MSLGDSNPAKARCTIDTHGEYVVQAGALLSRAVTVACEHSIEGVMGVLALFSRLPLDEQGSVWLRMFAEQAAVAIANAMDRLRDRKRSA
jgi:hypothetical protein